MDVIDKLYYLYNVIYFDLLSNSRKYKLNRDSSSLGNLSEIF